jgi:hypothetical protein
VTKTFTLSEAQTLLPVLEALVRRAHAATARASEIDHEMQMLSQRIFLSGGMHVNVAAAARRRAEHLKALQESKDTVEEIEEIGVRVQDYDAGLLDFPCLVEGKLVLLCWRLGEPTIAYWHGERDGFDARRPVETLFGKSEKERPN